MSQVAVPCPPAIDLDHELTAGFAARFIRRKARQLMGLAALRDADRPDLEQSLLLAVWRAAPHFDPAAGDWESFVATVVERHAAQIVIRRRRAKHRLDGTVHSLDVLVKDADGVDVPLATQIGPQHREGLTGRYAPSEAERFEAKHDVAVMLDAAPPRTRQLCEQLQFQSEREVAEANQIERRTVRVHLRRLRDKFNGERIPKNCPERVAHTVAKRKA